MVISATITSSVFRGAFSSLSLQTKSNVNDLFLWSTLVALSGWSSDAQNYKFGIVRIDLCYTDWPLSKTIVIVLYDKLALSEGIFATLCNKISVVWDNLCYIMTYTIKLARLNLNINWANISTNSELCFDLRTCNSNKIEYVIALAEIKPKLLL